MNLDVGGRGAGIPRPRRGIAGPGKDQTVGAAQALLNADLRLATVCFPCRPIGGQSGGNIIECGRRINGGGGNITGFERIHSQGNGTSHRATWYGFFLFRRARPCPPATNPCQACSSVVKLGDFAGISRKLAAGPGRVVGEPGGRPEPAERTKPANGDRKSRVIKPMGQADQSQRPVPQELFFQRAVLRELFRVAR